MQTLIDIFIPLGIILMMLIVGLDLALEDLRKVKQFPGTLFIAVIGQLLLLPIIGIIIAVTFKPEPAIAAGLILVTACPGGGNFKLLCLPGKGQRCSLGMLDRDFNIN